MCDVLIKEDFCRVLLMIDFRVRVFFGLQGFFSGQDGLGVEKNGGWDITFREMTD